MLGRNALVGIVAGGLVLYMVGVHDGRAASTVAMACDPTAPGMVAVTISWRAPDSTATETWLDLGVSPEFVADTYQAYGPLPPDAREYTVSNTALGVGYRYRVNALHPDGWHEIGSGTFVAACPPPPAP